MGGIVCDLHGRTTLPGLRSDRHWLALGGETSVVAGGEHVREARRVDRA
jgi:hypothetical protein